MQRSDQQQGTVAYLLACVALLSLLLGGCRQRNNQASEEVAVSPTPTATAIQVVAVPTFSPTPEPTATNSPVPTPLPGFNVNANASLRSGPGDDFDVAGEIRAGERVMPTARSDDGNWVRLPQGWIRADTVDDLPLSGLPIVVPTPNLVLATVNAEIGAYVRAGPGTTFRVVDRLEQGTPVEPIARTRDASWVQLANNGWIFSQLLDKVPANLPTAQNVPPPPTPTPTATPLPTAAPAFTPTSTPTPDPRREAWDDRITASSEWPEPFPDGLTIRVPGFIRVSEDIDTYMSASPGENCTKCLVVELWLANTKGRAYEYTALQDFQLQLHTSFDESIKAESCDRGRTLSLGDSNDGSGSQSISQSDNREDNPLKVFVCFRNVEGTVSYIRENYSLSYTNRYFHPRATPTPTPKNDDRVRNPFRQEKDDPTLKGWFRFFELVEKPPQ